MIKPAWLNKRVKLSACHNLKNTLRRYRLHTVCEEALCPNISECFSCGVVTFIILGDICTRGCNFCGIKKGEPFKPDFDEPGRVKRAVKELGLSYVVITSPTRDDLFDCGAEIFCRTIKAIKSLNSKITIELLIPDFLGKAELIKRIAYCGAQVVSHNLETTPSLYLQIRKGASYQRSLGILKLLKGMNKQIFTKSGLMLGLGENDNEVIGVLRDLRKTECDFLTLGQYLPPSLTSYPLKEYVEPAKFTYFRKYALALGFKDVKSAPYVRSSYLAHTFINNQKHFT
ncbi:MAG: lipoyl synthase [Omnitrophica bacterium]|nr:lipoyl synthase [Candidatus Omnitrophota bacterium]